ncbi:MAG TPA: hypothetical protein VLY21_01115 [Nitrososphaerales archaeon]|nr:hypothetical protein [Nitrososphaerales archaeon]
MQETSGLETLGESGSTHVKVDGEEAVLHITEQSVMFEKGGKVSGFERTAIRMVKPDGDAMIVAYSAGSEVKSVRVEPMTAVASLLLGDSASNRPGVSVAGLDEVFERLYRDTRKELEAKLARIETDPQDKTLRSTPEEEARYDETVTRMGNIIGAKFNFNPGAEGTPISFWELEKQPHEVQLAVVKVRHIRFLRMIVGSKAEKSDIVYSTDEVWPEDWPGILNRFGLGSGPYITEAFNGYVNSLKQHWKYHPTEKKPVLARR